jgi:hypothetical protein
MQIFCEKCNENHEFSPLDAERLIYGMQCEISTALTDSHDGMPYYQQFKSQDEPAFFCLVEAHASIAGDVEMYGEHVSASVERRREIQGVVGCDECREDVPGCPCEAPRLPFA